MAAALYLDRMWHVGLVEAEMASFLEPGFRPPVKWLPRPAFADFLADPFGALRNGQLTLFAEAYDYGARRGRIVCMRRDGDSWSAPEDAYVPRHHVSFPYLFEAAEKLFCIPEQWQAGVLTIHEVELGQGKIASAVVRVADVEAIDPVCFEHGGRHWVLCLERSTNAMLAFHAASPFGPYFPHALNPVLVGPRSRNAGSVFSANGKLIRPAMCNRRRYGHAVELCEIVELSVERYVERPLQRIEPWDREHSLGFHTLSCVAGLTLVDGLRPSWVPSFARAFAARRAARSRAAAALEHR